MQCFKGKTYNRERRGIWWWLQKGRSTCLGMYRCRMSFRAVLNQGIPSSPGFSGLQLTAECVLPVQAAKELAFFFFLSQQHFGQKHISSSLKLLKSMLRQMDTKKKSKGLLIWQFSLKEIGIHGRYLRREMTFRCEFVKQCSSNCSEMMLEEGKR